MDSITIRNIDVTVYLGPEAGGMRAVYLANDAIGDLFLDADGLVVRLDAYADGLGPRDTNLPVPEMAAREIVKVHVAPKEDTP